MKAFGPAAFIGLLSGCISLPEGIKPILQGQAEPEPGNSGMCTATETTPAVIETITEDILLKPAEIAADGSIESPAIFETRTRQAITQERRAVEFETPCPPTYTTQFVANLQRALKARGHFNGPTTGVMDAETARAIKSYQSTFGLNSATLSSDAARRLGLLVVDS